MSKKYKRDAMAAIHEMMEDLHVGGVFDDACLTPIRPLKRKEIKEFARENTSAKPFLPTT